MEFLDKKEPLKEIHEKIKEFYEYCKTFGGIVVSSGRNNGYLAFPGKFENYQIIPNYDNELKNYLLTWAKYAKEYVEYIITKNTSGNIPIF